MSISNRTKVGIIGFGEVGGIFAADLARPGADVAVFDTRAEAKQRAASPELRHTARPTRSSATHGTAA